MLLIFRQAARFTLSAMMMHDFWSLGTEDSLKLDQDRSYRHIFCHFRSRTAGATLGAKLGTAGVAS